ncbi:MAG: pilus (MSHA type) biogenesis protein MshL [Myxococcales bacterium]|nr:pilus (MSHA type) biogenesis protein MshL [Myxococcales bacterium]
MKHLSIRDAAARAVACVSLGLLLGSCRTLESPLPRPIDDTFADLHSIPTPPPPPPLAVRESLRPSLVGSDEPDAAPSPAEPRFDVAVDRAPIRSFLMNLVEGTPHGMIVHPSVTGEVSMNLKNVTVDQVLASVRDVYGFPYRRVEGGFEVSSAAIATQVFHIDYLNLSRQGHSETRVSSGQVSEQGGVGSSDASGSSSSSSTVSAMTGTQVETDTAADFWKELVATLNTIVGTAPGRAVMASPHAGVVTVRAMPAELAEVERYLVEAQRNLRRQVIIEAKILEVGLSDGYQQGINWSTVLGNSLTLSQTGGGTTLGGSQSLVNSVAPSDIAGNSGILDPNMLAMIQGAASSAFGGVFSIAVALEDFAAFIELLEAQGDVEVLSSPRISTLNNQKAVIKVGSDEFFVTDVSTTTVTGTATTTSPDVTLTPFFSGIALDVTPRISPEGDITLHVHPSVSQVTDQTKQIDLGGDVATLSLPLAFSTVRESDSIVRAKSGQVIVIGGLIENVVDEDSAQLPLLGDIPWLGKFFQHKRQVSRKNELVILLRPEVVDAGVWTRRVEETSDRYDRLRRLD